VFGFLLKGGKTFTVLTLGLEVKAYKQIPPETPPQSRVGYEKMNLSTLTDRYLKTWPNAVERGELDGLQDKLWYVHLKGLTGAALSREERIQHHLYTRLSEPTEVFIAAWACQRQGSAALAERLYERARSIPRDPQRTSAKSLQELVAEELSWAEIWRTAEAFEDVELSWVQMRERCERIIRICPDNTCVPEVRERVKILNRMIREEAEHARQRQNAPPFEKLSKTEQIAELVFQLRNQTGRRVFTSFTGKEMHDSPAHRLARMGYEVIPALVEILGDKRMTRSVEYTGAGSGPIDLCDFFCRHMVTVGHCAEYIIERIAGRSFSAPDQKYGDTAALKPIIRAWYAELLRKGEKRMLIEAVERGDGNSSSQGALLLERYPLDALTALVKGARVPRDYPPIREELVALICRVRGDEPLGFLLEEIKKGPCVVSRVAAAQGLNARNRREGVTTMIGEWNAGLPVMDSNNMWANKSSYMLARIARFLASSGSVEAIEALSNGLRKRPVGLRVEVISAFLGSESWVTFASGKEGGRERDNNAAKRAKVREAVERLLVAALDDSDQENRSGIWMGKPISNPRVCDYAGHVLYEIDSGKYPFDLAAPLAERNRSLLELKSAWRKARQ
jgi:hypothetical protein